MHIPVLLKEVLEFLDLKPGKFIIDGTVDGGGHSKEIIKKISPDGMLLGCDLDKEMVELAEKNLKELAERQKVKLILVHCNYSKIPDVLKDKKIGKADGLLLDLGFSSEHLEKSGRGFSFLKDEPLIMTYDDSFLSARDFLNQASFEEIKRVLKEYGEERYAGLIAKKIIEKRKIKKINTTQDLVEIIKEAVPLSYLYKRIHPATKTFQALRIYLNQELENLKKILERLQDILKPNGRIVIISFHSLEDRIVKNFFKKMSENKQLKILTKKPVVPTKEEIQKNSKSRSAKLRSGIIL